MAFCLGSISKVLRASVQAEYNGPNKLETAKVRVWVLNARETTERMPQKNITQESPAKAKLYIAEEDHSCTKQLCG